MRINRNGKTLKKSTLYYQKQKKLIKKKSNSRNNLPFYGNTCYSVTRNSDLQNVKGVINMANVYDIANWFLHKSSMTHKKLQKLCYYAQAWSYALKNKPIIDSEFQAWVHGPVSPELYERYKGSGMADLEYNPRGHFDFSPEEEELLESVWETYGEYSGNALEVLTHSEPPWRNARVGCSSSQRCREVISKNDMRDYYKSIYIGDTVSDA